MGEGAEKRVFIGIVPFLLLMGERKQVCQRLVVPLVPFSLFGPERKIYFDGQTGFQRQSEIFSFSFSVFQVISHSTYWGSPSRAVQLLGK